MTGPAPDNALAEPLGEVMQRLACDPGLGSWSEVLQRWLDSAQGRRLVQAVESRQTQGAVVYPAEVLRALFLTPLPAARVVILGQDPYHGPGQAQGLAFSARPGGRLPPSLRNILQEVQRDTGGLDSLAQRGDLSGWARQGVLLLNTALTVEEGRPGAHARLGWEGLADALVAAVVERAQADRRPLVLMLWGAQAQARRPVIAQADPLGHCLILSANHPSPLSARRPPTPFLGCGHFSRAALHLGVSDPSAPPMRW